ncbi:VPLPA-CTERM sorting domain-containing protein [Thiobaca trueperi]|uniref:Putative secreted protein n=1 Tax=Thiobaca trueperi TaxID=127458 RepID=A0A4R3N9X9_9GAMM|nr:VPLPA-CTERM sorting domain-containing protein [Thiobaca trueperi]TCT23963.1 putative secreted protein [Thiobaca trueperi]
MTSKTLAWLIPLAGAVFMASAQAATLEIYTDRSAWASKTGAFATETFDDSPLDNGLKLTSTQGRVAQGIWQDVLSQDIYGNELSNTRFSFADGVTSIGGDWDTRPAGHGTKIWLTLFHGATQILSREIPHIEGSFWGLISDTAFTDIVLTSSDGSGSQEIYRRETYHLDNFTYGTSNASDKLASVPLPAAFWLFASGLLGLFSIRRQNRSPRSAL